MLLSEMLKTLKASIYLRTVDSLGQAPLQVFTFQGIPVVIENDVGTVRTGKNNSGRMWQTRFYYPYGYILGTVGADGEEIDCFIGPNERAKFVFIIRQKNENGGYDEQKVMLGFDDKDHARDAYLAHFDTQGHLGLVEVLPIEEFKRNLFVVETTMDASEFKEEEHPRDELGQFTEKGTGVSANKSDKKRIKVGSKKQTMLPTKTVAGKLVGADNKPLPDHIQKLRIPPAWKDVVYNPNPNESLLVKGKDSKGRAQYIYSEKHRNKKAMAKFSRIEELNNKFTEIVKENLNRISKGPNKEEALVLNLIIHTGIRPGSNVDVKASKKAYGATTLKGEHVEKLEDGVLLRFVGKKGVQNNVKVSDPILVKELISRANKVGKDGNLFKTDNIKLLHYTSGLDGGKFRPKDFRTLLGTKFAIEEIKKSDPPKNEKQYKKAVKQVAKVVASKLGNTPSVALKAYINPVVFAEWQHGMSK